MIFAVNAGERKAPENMDKMSNAAIWRETIALMEESMVKIPEEQRAAYEQKIRQKMQSGKKLTPEEMNYLRVYQPELYRSALRVENERKVLRTKLHNCKSKEEVENVVSVQREVLRAAKGDPDREYLTAMVNREVENFKKSNAYARLPKRTDDKKKKTAGTEVAIFKDEEEGADSSNRMMILGQMQNQCEMISQMSKAFVA